MSDPIEPLTQLGKRLQSQAESIGLRMVTFSVVPDPSGDHHVHASFIPSENPVPESSDPEFDKIMEDQRRHELEERAKKEREELLKFRENLDDKGKGFLDD